MLSILIMCSLWKTQQLTPPPIVPRGMMRTPTDPREHLQDHLNASRDRRKGVEGMIEMFERHLNTAPYLFTPRQAERTRQQMEWLKGQAAFMARLEQELERYDCERATDIDLWSYEVHLRRFRTIMREWNQWDEAWEAGRVAPQPRDVKP